MQCFTTLCQILQYVFLNGMAAAYFTNAETVPDFVQFINTRASHNDPLQNRFRVNHLSTTANAEIKKVFILEGFSSGEKYFFEMST